MIIREAEDIGKTDIEIWNAQIFNSNVIKQIRLQIAARYSHECKN